VYTILKGNKKNELFSEKNFKRWRNLESMINIFIFKYK
jgi:hypothetical protein